MRSAAAILAVAIWYPAASAQPQQAKAAEIHAHIVRAESALRTGDQETAAREFRAALSLDPRNSEARVNLGVIAFARGDCSAATEDLRAALRSRPSLVKAQALLGICEKRLADSAARHDLEKSFAQLDDPKLRAQVGRELVGLYYGDGRADQAVPVMQKLVDIAPEDPDALFTAQRLYQELADDTLNKLAIVAPASARMQQAIAERLINAGDLPGAIQHYKQALELNAQLPGVRYELAEALLESNRSDGQMQAASQEQIEKAKQVDGDSSNLESLLGEIALLQNDLRLAYTHYAEAIRLNRGSPEAQLGFGRVLLLMDKPQEARKYLQMAVRSDPLNSSAHYRLALADRKLGLEEEAHKEARLTDEIRHLKDNVGLLYQQMHQQTRPEPGAGDQEQ
jgi:tetratricopeptide (TPR) repeat protein